MTKKYGWWANTAYGPMQKPTGLYFLVRIKRCRGYTSLLKQAIDGQWIKLGDFATVNLALEALKDEVETMEHIEGMNDAGIFTAPGD